MGLAGVSSGDEEKAIPPELDDIAVETDAEERKRMSTKSTTLSHPIHCFGDLSHMIVFVARAFWYPNTHRV